MFRRKARQEPIIITVAEAIDPTHTVVMRCMNRTLTAEQAKAVKDHMGTIMPNRVVVVGSDWEWLVFADEDQIKLAKRVAKAIKASSVPGRDISGRTRI